MKPVVTALAATAAVVVAAFLLFSPHDKPLADSTVKIVLSDGWGSGVNIGGGYILTAGHVAADLKTVDFKTSDGVSGTASVLWVNNDYDIALLFISGKTPPMNWSPLSCAPLTTNQLIVAEGSPAALEFVRLAGHVAGTPREQGPWHSVVPVDMTIIQGMSGGPVLDEHGNVAGISVGVMGAPMQGTPFASDSGIGFVVPSSAICELLART